MTTKPDPNPTIASSVPAKRQYRRRSITNGPGTKLVIEQEMKLAEARKIARALNDIATMSEWGLEQIKFAHSIRLDEVKRPTP